MPVTDPALRRRRVLVVLPYEMSARNFIQAPVARHLAETSGLDITIVSRDPSDAQTLAELEVACCGRTSDLPTRLRWTPMLRPFHGYAQGWWRSQDGWGRLLGDVRFALGFYLHLMLVYRFNTLHGFQGFNDRLRQSRPLRRAAFREGLPTLGFLGFPLPRSRRLFEFLRGLYFRRWQRHPLIERLFEATSPDLVVLTHLQTSAVTPYLLSARARGIRLIGLNGSWDQPTTKGPLVDGLEHVVVQSRNVRRELNALHGFPVDRIEIAGWPQMDVYAATRANIRPRTEFLQRLGLSMDRRFVLVGAYAERLGAHEPEMCRRLAVHIQAGNMGKNTTLYVRCHPLDQQWRERLGSLHDPPNVIVEPPQLGDLSHLADLIAHADVVVSSAGTINLDAVALDTPAIAVAFEDGSQPYYDRPARRYAMEHYAAVLSTGGIRLVASQQELEQAIEMYRADRSLDAAGRAHLRAEFLEPLDGCASWRTAQAIVRASGLLSCNNPSVRNDSNS